MIHRHGNGLHLGAVASNSSSSSSNSAWHPAGVAERCSPEENQQQVAFFKVATSNRKSSCPDFSYIPDLEPFAGPDPVVFDVGCNKAYDSAMLFEAFAPQEEFSRIVLGRFYEANEELRSSIVNVTKTDVCGACKDCKESVLKESSYQRHAARPLAQGRKLQVHCFEPSASNYYVLTKIHERFFGSDNKTTNGNELQLHRIAMSNYSGTADFPSDCDELCQLPMNKGSAAASSANAVPVTTVDAMMEQLGLQQLFLLKIDTEGFDVLVLQGARKALAAHKIDIVLFEYHGIGLWGKTPAFTLKAVTADMEMLGYICYLEGKLLTRLTGCWNDAFEFKAWSNVVCVASTKPLQAVLRAYSLAPFAGRYR
uniref:Methyltransferase FkbM domain-containing protein n=1 Tax=Tetradesmus obliquus TaxID=3088 RepID=A0A383W2E1_TETOB|eukprot:jgi/Sobl393_1/3992/SZX71204.1